MNFIPYNTLTRKANLLTKMTSAATVSLWFIYFTCLVISTYYDTTCGGYLLTVFPLMDGMSWPNILLAVLMLESVTEQWVVNFGCTISF